MDYVKGKSIFTSLNSVPKQYQYLTEDIDTDVVIIGGGVTGAILGYYFSKNNINSVLLEKDRVAHLSTSITTSLLQYELDSNESELRSVTSTQNTIKAYKAGLDALSEIENIINRYGNYCNFKKTDCLLYTNKKLECKEIEQEYNLRKDNGFNVDLIDGSNNPFSFEMTKGLVSKNGGAVFDPYKFTHSLLQISEQLGLKIYENSEVVGINYYNDKVVVNTKYDHNVNAKFAIVATGYNTKQFTDREFATFTTAFNVATKPINNLEQIYKNYVFRDNMDIYHYFRATHDNRLILGGEDVGFTSGINNDSVCKKAYENLEQLLKHMFPQYDIEIEYKYCGAFASTRDNIGLIGADNFHERLWYCLGYGANGILFAVIGAKILVDKYYGKSNTYAKLFDISRDSL